MISSFSGSKIRKGIPSRDVLSQLLEWTCLYLFKPCAIRQPQAHPGVQELQLRHLSLAVILQKPLWRAPLLSLSQVNDITCGKGASRHSERSLRSEESLLDFRFRVHWILLVAVRGLCEYPHFAICTKSALAAASGCSVCRPRQLSRIPTCCTQLTVHLGAHPLCV